LPSWSWKPLIHSLKGCRKHPMQHSLLFRTPPGPGQFLISSLRSLMLFHPVLPYISFSVLLITSTLCPVTYSPDPEGPLKGPFSLTSVSLACPFPLMARLRHASSFLLAPGPHPIPTLFPIGPVKVSALADWFLYLKPIPRVAYSSP
jgi:hypothetical protein